MALADEVRTAEFLVLRLRELVSAVDPDTANGLVDGFAEDEDESIGTSALAAINKAYRELIGTGHAVCDFTDTLTSGTRGYRLDADVQEIVSAELYESTDTDFEQPYPLEVVHRTSNNNYPYGRGRAWRVRTSGRPRQMMMLDMMRYEFDRNPDAAYVLKIQAYAYPGDLVEHTDIPDALSLTYQDKLAVGAAVSISTMQSANQAARVRYAEYKMEWEQAKREIKALVHNRQVNPPARQVPISKSGYSSYYGGR